MCRHGAGPVSPFSPSLSTVGWFTSLLSVALCLRPPALLATGPPPAVYRAEPPPPDPTEPPQAACRLPRDRGRRCPDGPVLRWFLDEDQGDCVSFWFGGCGGNTNNFPSERACREVCVTASGAAACLLPAGRGPCTDSRLLWTFDAESGQCVTFVYGGCYGTSNRFFTRRQCERACLTDPDAGGGGGGGEGGGGANPECLQRAGASGQCGAELVRYTYLAAADVCTPFLYGGCAGNDNNFGTLEECSERCLTLADSGSETENSQNSTGTTAEEGQTREGELQKMTTEPGGSVELCYLPRDSGSCLSYAPMFYYDVRTSSCHQFIYRGCGGNANRFHTHSECRQRCVTALAITGEETATDGSVQMNGTDAEASTMDTEGSDIIDGNVTGISDAELGFTVDVTAVTEPNIGTAMETTAGAVQVSVRSTVPPVSTATTATTHRRQPGGRRRRLPRGRRACLLRPRPGPCHHYLPQFYYYNADLAGCFTFIYGGCGGNRNRFSTKEACENHCRGVRRRRQGRRRVPRPGEGDTRPDRPRRPARLGDGEETHCGNDTVRLRKCEDLERC